MRSRRLVAAHLLPVVAEHMAAVAVAADAGGGGGGGRGGGGGLATYTRYVSVSGAFYRVRRAPLAAEAVEVVAVAEPRVAARLQLVEHLRLPAQHLLLRLPLRLP